MTPYQVIALFLVVGCGRSGFDVVASDAVGDAGNNGDSDGAGNGGPDARVDYISTFARYTPAGAPTARRSSGAALQPSSPERLWMYGGYNGTFHADVRYFEPMTNTWFAPVTSGVSPGMRERHALAWDPVGNALVIFGGQNRPTIQLVHYDTLHVLVAGTFTPISKVGNWPAARKDATLLWIPHLSKFLLHGGDDGGMASNRFSDLWLLTLNAGAGTGSWQQLVPGGVPAPAQSSACVVYDAAARRMILYGGETADGVDVSTTYQYLLDTNVWQLDATTGTPPMGRSFGQCAWDPLSNRVLFYGGQFAGGTPIGGHATYDPDAHVWTSPMNTSGVSIGNWSDGGAVYSRALGGMITYGGRTAGISYTSELFLMTILAVL